MTSPIEFKWPHDWVPETSTFDVLPTSLYATNPFRAGRRMLGPVVYQWRGRFTLPPDRTWYRKAALVARLQGGAQYVRIFDPHRCYPRGTAAGLNLATAKAILASTGEPFSDGTLFSDGMGWSDASGVASLAKSAPVGADTVIVGELIASQPLSLAQGDLLEIGGYVYEVLNDAPSNADGEAQVMICPPLRKAALAGDSVNLDHPTSPFQIIQEDEPPIEREPSNLGSFGFSFVEALTEL